jgi:hypothetical protein
MLNCGDCIRSVSNRRKGVGELVGMATRLRVGRSENGGYISSRYKRIFIFAQSTDQLWGPRNFVPNGYRGSFTLCLSARYVRLTTGLHLVR